MNRLGQHFLKNKVAIQKIVEGLELQKGDEVIEIGPGHGELTMPLEAACGRIGCKITVIEKDEALAEQLEKLLPAISITKGDALKMLPSIARVLSAKSYKIAGNIPYYITGKLLRTIGDLENKPEQTLLTIQKEVAERICEQPPRMNRLAASIQFWADPKILGFISKKDFSPPPDVDSATIILKTRPASYPIEPLRYYEALKAIFAQPRKTIANNIMAAKGPKATKNDIFEALKGSGLDEGARPQNLSVEQLAALAKSFF